MWNICPVFSNPIGREDVNFMQGWTSFYWAWWISWSPFVGMFIARVSRGRSVREFLTCVLLIPSLVCVLWMSVFGGMAIDQVISDGYTAAQEAELPRQLFAMLDALPLAGITSLIGIVLVIVFFVTSSDSGSAGDRYDHGRRQGRRTCATARVLVHLRRCRSDRIAAVCRRAQVASVDGYLYRIAFYCGCCCSCATQSSAACAPR